jgi:hypothetical protein
MLEARGSFQEAHETVKLRQAGESSALATIATTLSLGLQDVIRTHTWWTGGDRTGVQVVVNTDFDVRSLTPAELTALVTAWQAGAISHQTLYQSLIVGEIARAGVSFEEEKQEIASDQPLESLEE